MSRKSKLTFHILLLCTINGIYFIWQYYPKHILILAQGNTVIPDILTNILYFAIYFLCLILMAKPREYPLSWKKYIGTIALLFAVQIGFDILKILGNSFSFYAIIVNDVCSVLCVVVTWLVLVKLLPIKFYTSLKDHLWFVLGGGLIVCLSFIIITLFNIRDIRELETAVQKLSDLSQLMQLTHNKEFFVQIRNMLLETITSLYLVVVFHRLTSDTEKPQKRSSYDQRNRFFASILLLGIGTWAIAGIKLVVLPHSAIMSMKAHHSTHDSLIPQPEFDLEYSTMEIQRGTGYWTQETVCSIDTIDVYYADKKLLSFIKCYGGTPGLPELYPGHIVIPDPIKELSIPGVEAYVYQNDVLMFVEDGKPKAMLLENINRSKENDILTKICKVMIEQGNWDYFEHGYKYLEKYAPDFLQPYVERYASGDFTSAELSLNAHIYPTYIQRLAQSIG